MHYYVFVRTDIPLPDQICQTAHACLHSGKRFRHAYNTNLVLIQVPDLVALKKVEDICAANQIGFFTHFEPDDDMQETALATAPLDGNQRKLFSQFPLWRHHIEP